MNGVTRIWKERRRQIEEEGWTANRDDEYNHGELARAAACYAKPGPHRRYVSTIRGNIPSDWPWLAMWWKPTPDDRIRELEKAGALIAAEIDRLQRKGPKP